MDHFFKKLYISCISRYKEPIIVKGDVNNISPAERKRRDWPRWAWSSKVDIHLVLRHKAVKRPSLAASKIPSEVINDILYWASSTVKTSQLSLTCHYWAEKCRERLFSSLWIYSLEDLHNLRSWRPHVESFVDTILIRYEQETIPWTHLLNMPSHSPFPRWKKQTHITLCVDVQQVASIHTSQIKCFRSLHALTPRPVPGSFSHVRSLNLHCHHFSCFGDLLHIVWELPCLENLDCFELSWDIPNEPPRFSTTRRGSSLDSVLANSCPDPQYLVWLFVILGVHVQTAGSKAAWPWTLAPPEVYPLTEIVKRHIIFSMTTTLLSSRSRNTDSEEPSDPTVAWACWIKVNGMVLYYAPDPTQNPNNPSPSYHIVQARIPLAPENMQLEAEDDNHWHELDEQADLLPYLHHLDLVVNTGWGLPEDFATIYDAFVERTESQMPKMRSSGRLRFLKENISGYTTEPL